MNNYTSRLIKILSGLRCPVCGKNPTITPTFGESYLQNTCHKELAELIEKTEQAHAAAMNEKPKGITVRLKKPPYD